MNDIYSTFCLTRLGVIFSRWMLCGNKFDGSRPGERLRLAEPSPDFSQRDGWGVSQGGSRWASLRGVATRIRRSDG